MSAERVLVDTSVWIEYFREPESEIGAVLDALMDDHEVFVPKIVLAELIQGAKSSREIAVLGGLLEAFHIIDHGSETWMKAGRLAYDLKKKGRTVHLTDCYLAVLACENDCRIFTLNRHFQDIEDLAGLKLWKWSG